MAAMIFSIISVIFSLLLMATFGSSYLYLKEGKRFKIANFYLFCIASAISLFSLIILLINRLVYYSDKNELLMNFQISFILIDVVMTALYLIWFNVNNNVPFIIKENRTEKIVSNIIEASNYIFALLIWIMLIVISVTGGQYLEGSESVKRFLLDNALSSVRILFLVLSALQFALLMIYSVHELIKVIKNKDIRNFYNITKITSVLLGYITILAVLIYTTISLYKFSDQSSWFFKEIEELFVKSYTNSYSYISIYLSLLGTILITAKYVPSLEAKK